MAKIIAKRVKVIKVVKKITQRMKGCNERIHIKRMVKDNNG
jgi:hypothetical protein